VTRCCSDELTVGADRNVRTEVAAVERPRPQRWPPSQLHSVSLGTAARNVRTHDNQGRSSSVTKMTLHPG